MLGEYLKLGFDHILDWNGYDHILFVAVLCAMYSWKEWKKILILVTSFTVGHSLTLALSSLNIVQVNAQLVETLIPMTIILTGVFNIIISLKKTITKSNLALNYFLAVFFGLIHGLGFSNFFKALISSEESILMPLFAFNVGVEIGQIIIVGMIMLLTYIFIRYSKVEKIYWTITISTIAIVAATLLLIGV
ncbi:MAG: HupE/UreJ family protein [Saprospiraceae bacterium]